MQFVKNSKIGLTVKYKNHFFLWFQGSNQWLVMHEPGWFTFDALFNEKHNQKEVADKIAGIYGLTIDESFQLIREVKKVNSIANKRSKNKYPGHALSDYKNLKSNNDNTTFPIKTSTDSEQNLTKNYSTFSFSFTADEKSFAIDYDRPEYGDYLFSAFKKSKTNPKEDPAFRFSIHKNDNGYFLKRTNPDNEWQFDDLSYLKGRLNLEIVNTLANKSDTDWMSVVHGAAVTNGRKTLLFVAESGKGKSTITALLHAKGYNFISDDMVALDKSNGFAFSVPGAISVKPGAFKTVEPYFSELEKTVTLKIHETGKEIKYIFSDEQNSALKPGVEVSQIIYLEYDPKTKFLLEKTDFTESLQRFNTEAWIIPHNENIIAHLKWLFKTPSYRMVYSDTQKALETCIGFLES